MSFACGRTSAIRATVMLTVVIVGWVLRRPSDLVNSLFVAALIILLWEPRQLFQAGFQLSFIVVLCMILALPAMLELGRRLSAPDPLLPDHLRPRWQQTLRVHVPQELQAEQRIAVSDGLDELCRWQRGWPVDGGAYQRGDGVHVEPFELQRIQQKP